MTYQKDKLPYIEYIRDQIWQQTIGERVSGRAMIIDVGCGPGITWNTLVGSNLRKMQIEVVGADLMFDNPTIIKAKQMGVSLVLCDAHHLPFKNEALDTVLCQEVLEHLPNPYLALSEMSRVLKKGGTVILDVPCLLDRITVPTFIPFIKISESVAAIVLRTKASSEKQQIGVKPKHRNIGVGSRVNKSIEAVKPRLLSITLHKLVHLILTARYCSSEHRNRWAWSWVSVVKQSGLTIDTISSCVLLYPLSFICSNYERLLPLEQKLSKIPSLQFAGQLLCIVAKRS